MMKKYFHLLLIPLYLSSAFVLRAQEEEYGIASYYGDEFQGRRTAYGDTYDKNQLTAAHKKHPYGTYLKVTRLDNKKSVTVRVNDKGPFVKGRVVELSRKAAELIGLDRDGVTQVKVEVVKNPGTQAESALATSSTSPPRETAPATKPASYEETDKPKIAESSVKEKSASQPEPAPKKAEALVKDAKAKTAGSSAPAKFEVVRTDFQTYGLYKITLEKPDKKGYGVQVASLSSYENVLKQVADLQGKWFDNILVSIEPATGNKSIYKVILGPFDTEDAANKYQDSLKKKYKINGFTINLGDLKF